MYCNSPLINVLRSLPKPFLRNDYLMTLTTTLLLVLHRLSPRHRCTTKTSVLLTKRGCHNSLCLQEISTATGFSMNIVLKMHSSCGLSSTSTITWTSFQQPIFSQTQPHHNARTSRPFRKKHGNISAWHPTIGSITLAKKRAVLKVPIYVNIIFICKIT